MRAIPVLFSHNVRIISENFDSYLLECHQQVTSHLSGASIAPPMLALPHPPGWGYKAVMGQYDIPARLPDNKVQVMDMMIS